MSRLIEKSYERRTSTCCTFTFVQNPDLDFYKPKRRDQEMPSKDIQKIWQLAAIIVNTDHRANVANQYVFNWLFAPDYPSFSKTQEKRIFHVTIFEGVDRGVKASPPSRPLRPTSPLPPPRLPPPFWSGARIARAKFSSFPLPPFSPPLSLLPPPLLPPPSPSSPPSGPLISPLPLTLSAPSYFGV